MTLQFFSEDLDYEEIVWVDETNATDAYIEWADGLPARMLHVVYVHNLAFDLPEFLWAVKEKLAESATEYNFDIGEWTFHGFYGSPTFCRMVNKRQNKTVMLVDSFLWYQGSLAKAAELFCPDLPKLKMPDGLGTKLFKMNDEKFYEYAMRDAEVAYHIGKSVQAMIAEFNIMQPVSLADMSAKIFRHHFLQHTIPQPNKSVILGALKSYHGGKNNVVKGAAPAWHMNVTSFDISSAYPYAMAQLPSMSYQRLYKRYHKTIKAVRNVPELGVYCVSGIASVCDWPVIFSHEFKPIQGKFENVWIQGHELNEALRAGELKIKSIRGTYYEQEKDNRKSPFREYVEHFYRLKETEKDPVKRYGYKLNLNSVYGKFIQTRKTSRVPYTDIDSGETSETFDVIAGGMFHPFIASAITAHTRAYIHRCEHEYKAFHTATDGFYSNVKKPKRMKGRPAKGLGSIGIEGQGDLCLIRNKCYILYSKNGATKSQYFKGKKITKYAKHGFQGTVYDLEKCIAHGTRRYKASRPNRLKESIKRGLNVNEFIERPYVLKVGPIRMAKAQ
jgi:hypothetical protein